MSTAALERQRERHEGLGDAFDVHVSDRDDRCSAAGLRDASASDRSTAPAEGKFVGVFFVDERAPAESVFLKRTSKASPS